MRNVILISHGKLSTGMAHTVQMIVGEKENLKSYGLMPGNITDTMMNEIRELILANPNQQYLIISDIFGGSVCNASVTLQELPNVLLATGMNLLMVVQLLFSNEDISEEEFHRIVESSTETVRVLPKITGESADEGDFF